MGRWMVAVGLHAYITARKKTINNFDKAVWNRQTMQELWPQRTFLWPQPQRTFPGAEPKQTPTYSPRPEVCPIYIHPCARTHTIHTRQKRFLVAPTRSNSCLFHAMLANSQRSGLRMGVRMRELQMIANCDLPTQSASAALESS